jgi:nucleotide-binding universal stress UspA family protein
MDTAVGAATTHEPTVPVDAEIRTGQAIPILLDQAREACLLVLGSRGLGGFSGLLLGSVAVATSARAECPVAVVREVGEAAPHSPKPVVVGVDRSADSEAALLFAFDAAQARGVPLEVVYAVVDSALHPDTVPALDWSSIEAEERARLDEWLAGWSRKYRQVPTRTIVTRDNPGRALVERSARAQLVVVGSRGRGGLAGPLLGSVSQALLHHAHCPVVVAHGSE